MLLLPNEEYSGRIVDVSVGEVGKEDEGKIFLNESKWLKLFEWKSKNNKKLS